MEPLILFPAIACAVATVIHVVSAATTALRLRRSGQRRRPTAAFPAVSIVRPVCGLDNFAWQTFESGFKLAHPHYELIFCVAHAHDPAVLLIERLIAAYPRVSARLLIGVDAINANPKLNNMAKGWRAARHDWIVFVDSNVLMQPDYVANMLSAWRQDTGLVSSPPLACYPTGFWAELECAFLNTYQARWQYFADTVGLGFAQGKMLLWRQVDLEAAGGMRALGAEAAEDAAATKVVRQMGLRVRLADSPSRHPIGTRTAAQVWHRQARWARLRRATFPLFFCPEIFTGSLPALVTCALATAAAGGPVLAAVFALAALWYGVEALLGRALGWHLSRYSLLAWMLRDLCIPLIWLHAWTGRGFVWRGHSMRTANASHAG